MSTVIKTVTLLFIFFSGHVSGWHVILNPMNWTYASIYCQQQCLSNLASIHSNASYQSIKKLISIDYPETNTVGLWIGLYRNNPLATEFQWSDDTSFDFGYTNVEVDPPITVFPWNPDDPDVPNTGQQCVALEVLGWNDNRCAKLKPFVCNQCGSANPTSIPTTMPTTSNPTTYMPTTSMPTTSMPSTFIPTIDVANDGHVEEMESTLSDEVQFGNDIKKEGKYVLIIWIVVICCICTCVICSIVFVNIKRIRKRKQKHVINANYVMNSNDTLNNQSFDNENILSVSSSNCERDNNIEMNASALNTVDIQTTNEICTDGNDFIIDNDNETKGNIKHSNPNIKLDEFIVSEHDQTKGNTDFEVIDEHDYVTND